MKEISIDTETDHDLPFIATSTDTSLKSRLYKLETSHRDFHLLKRLCESSRINKIFHNAVYDIYCLSRIGIYVKPPYEDTMIAAALLNENYESKALKGLARIYLGEECKEEKELKKMKAKLKRQAKKVGKPFSYRMFPPDILYPYAVRDTEYTMKLWYLFKGPLEQYSDIYDMEKQLIPIVVEMIQNGFMVDRKFLKSIIKHYDRMLHRVKYRMSGLLDSHGIEIIRKKEKEYSLRYGRKKATERVFNFANKQDCSVKKIIINPGAGKLRAQLVEKFKPGSDYHLDCAIKGLNIPITETTGVKGYASTENLTLSKHKSRPFISALLSHKFYEKQMSSYYRPIYYHSTSDKDPIAHFIFFQSGAKSGRFSAKRIQTIPRKDQGKYEQERFVRRIFIPKPGYRYLMIDYDQVELRVFAHFSRCQRLVDAFRAGEDPHLDTAIALWGEQVAYMSADDITFYRKKAKAINFGIIYGMGTDLLASSLGLPMREAREILDRYHSMYPVKRYMRELKGELARTGRVRVEYHSELMDFYRDYRVPMDKAYKAANIVVQGSSAYVMKTGMIRCNSIIKSRGWDVKMIGTIHDELMFEVGVRENIRKIGRALIRQMEDKKTFSIDLFASAKVGDEGKSWRDVKDFDPFKD